MAGSEEILNSWKEIAAYLGRGQRTVQRWERELGLPAHRPRGKERSAVFAIRSEVDQWLASTPVSLLSRGTGATAEMLQARLLKLQKETKRVEAEIQRLRLQKNTQKASAKAG